MGIKHGLDLTWKLGFKSIICESDSREALRLAEDEEGDSHHYRGLIHEIRNILCRNWNVRLREANNCADVLAKQGANGDSGFQELSSPPATISHFLLANAASLLLDSSLVF